MPPNISRLFSCPNKALHAQQRFREQRAEQRAEHRCMNAAARATANLAHSNLFSRPRTVCKSTRIAVNSVPPLTTPPLPQLPVCKHFLNLTNGVEAVPLLESLKLQYSCLVWDFASRNKKRGLPRALWYGLEFVRYILRRLWFQRCTEAWLRRQNVTSVFEVHYNNLQKTTVAKLKYYMRYIPPGVTDVQLYGVSKATVHDPDPGYYRDIVHQSIWEGPEANAFRQQNPLPVPAEDVQSPAADAVPSSDLDAEVQLASYGYRVSFGGMYNVDDYRAM